MTTQRLSLLCGSLFLLGCATPAFAQGTNTGPGAQTPPGSPIANPVPINILGGLTGPGGCIVYPPVTAPLDTNSTQVWLSRGQSREYLAAGRVVTQRIHAANGGLQRITYRNYVKVDASAGTGSDDNDRLHVTLGPEQHQDFNPPVMLDPNPLVRQSERNTLLRKIDLWNQQIKLANEHLVANGDALQQTTDPNLQATYSNAYQQWSARKNTLEAELLNLQFLLCVRQE